MSELFELEELLKKRQLSDRSYHEFLRVAPMSAGVYVLPANAVDRQQPHQEDELYYVVRGKAKMQLGNSEISVKSGSVIFVEARLEHRFIEIEEELCVIVIFAPAESS